MLLSIFLWQKKLFVCGTRQIINTLFYLKRSVVTIQQDLRNPNKAANAAFTIYA